MKWDNWQPRGEERVVEEEGARRRRQTGIRRPREELGCVLTGKDALLLREGGFIRRCN